MIQQAYKCLLAFVALFNILFFELKTTNIWSHIEIKWVGTGKKMSCHGDIIFYSNRCVTCRTMSLPSFNGLCYKLATIVLFIYSV